MSAPLYPDHHARGERFHWISGGLWRRLPRDRRPWSRGPESERWLPWVGPCRIPELAARHAYCVVAAPLSVLVTYRPLLLPWQEQVCAENPVEHYEGEWIGLPRANDPDF